MPLCTVWECGIGIRAVVQCLTRGVMAEEMRSKTTSGRWPLRVQCVARERRGRGLPLGMLIKVNDWWFLLGYQTSGCNIVHDCGHLEATTAYWHRWCFHLGAARLSGCAYHIATTGQFPIDVVANCCFVGAHGCRCWRHRWNG